MKVILKSLQPVRNLYVIITILFIASIVFGYHSNALHSFLQAQLEGLEEIAASLEQSKHKLFWFIFWNNAIKSIVFMYAGILFGLLPIIFVTVNGMMIGFVLFLLGSVEGGRMSEFVIKGLLPHGIIEIPMLLLASAYGAALGLSIVRKLFSLQKEIKYEPVRLLKQSGIIVAILTVGLFIAALIEAYVTTLLLQ